MPGRSFPLFVLFFALCASLARADERVVCYTGYDEEYFYLAAVVSKPNLSGTQAAYFSEPLKDDAIAVFLQADSPESARRTPKSVQVAVSAAGGAQLYRGANGLPLTGFQSFLKTVNGTPVPFKTAVTRRGELNKPGGLDTGYTVEIAIPWIEIGGLPESGKTLRFNVIATSASSGSPQVISLSPDVKSADDIQSPAKWSEITLSDSPVKAPRGQVAVRVFSRKPLIDGSVTAAEWIAQTSFEFSDSGVVAVRGASPIDSARIKPEIKLKPAPPLVKPTASTPPALSKREPQTLPRLTMALYRYEAQADPRKSLPYRPSRSPAGATLLKSHPMDGDGPWMTYDSVDWHAGQLEQIRQAGIEVVLPHYRVDSESLHSHARRGLMTLASALQSLKSRRRDYPSIGLYLDTSAVSNRAAVADAIGEFFEQIPRPYRLAVPMRGGPVANLVILSSAAPVSDLDSGFLDFLRTRHLARFGVDLIVLGSSDFKAKCALDGYVDDAGAEGFKLESSGWIHPASLSAVAPLTADPGTTYRNRWKQAVAKRADWVILDGWNDFAEGTEIAPTLEKGLELADTTRASARAFTATGPGLTVLVTDLPARAAAGSTWTVNLRIENTGLAVLTPETSSITLAWSRAGSAVTGEPQIARLPGPLGPGDMVDLTAEVAIPPAGEYELTITAVSSQKKDAASAGVRLHLESVSADKLAPAASIVESSLPVTVESGGLYQARATLRNDSGKVWSKGTRVTGRVLKSTGETVDMADASAELAADVPPGKTVSVTVPVAFLKADGSPLQIWSPSSDWRYGFSLEVGGALTEQLPLAITDADAGAVFINDLTPRQLPGEKRIPIRISVRNEGPQTWRKDSVRIGAHWYYLDGIDAIFEDETTAVPQDVPPGAEVRDLLVYITPPPFDGPYWLVWDVKVADTWVSTLPGIRSGETKVNPVMVIGGRTRFVDLSKSFNVDGVSLPGEANDGSFDSSGRTFPGELIPPFVTGDTAPSTMWRNSQGAGIDSSRRIAFKWGPKGSKDKNLVQCQAQRIPLVPVGGKAESAKTIHILMASSERAVDGDFIIEFSSGTQQYASVKVAPWDGSALKGEEIAFASPIVRTRTGAAGNQPIHLFHYTLTTRDTSKLAALILPNKPEIKIAAITLEK